MSKILQALSRFATVATLACAASLVAAQNYPTHQVSLITGYQAGSATDVLARAVQPLMQKSLGQIVLVENVAGASGSIAIQRMLKANDEGHTLFLGTASDLILTPYQIPSVKYKAESVRLVSATAYTQMVLISRPSLAVKDLDALVEYAKNPANKPLNYASTGSGSIFHLTMEKFRQQIGVEMVHVPFTGLGQIATNVMGNHVDIGMVPLVGSIVQLINEGKLKALAVTGPKRNPQVANVPSVDETRAMKDFHVDMWVGLFAPVNTPPATLKRLNEVFNEAQSSPEFKKFADLSGVTPLEKPLSLDAAQKYYGEVISEYRQMAGAVKIEAK